jgi:hypothetical protein
MTLSAMNYLLYIAGLSLIETQNYHIKVILYVILLTAPPVAPNRESIKVILYVILLTAPPVDPNRESIKVICYFIDSTSSSS